MSFYSSPFRRARETAEIIASHVGINEIIELEVFADQQPTNFAGQLLDDILEGKVEVHPDDETNEQAYERVNKGFEEIVAKNSGKKVGIVFHGHPIRYIVWKHVEKRKDLRMIPEDFTKNNYPLQGEAWVLSINEEHELINSRLIARDDNPNPGVGSW